MARLFPSKGLFTRPRWDWTIDKAGAAGASQINVAAQFSFVYLLNDSNPAKDLGVYMLFGSAGTASSQMALFWATGALGAIVRNGQSVIAGGPQTPGAVYAGSAAAAPGNIIFPFISGAEGKLWHSTSPLWIIRPGYGIGVYPNVVNVTVVGAFMVAPL